MESTLSLRSGRLCGLEASRGSTMTDGPTRCGRTERTSITDRRIPRSWSKIDSVPKRTSDLEHGQRASLETGRGWRAKSARTVGSTLQTLGGFQSNPILAGRSVAGGERRGRSGEWRENKRVHSVRPERLGWVEQGLCQSRRSTSSGADQLRDLDLGFFPGCVLFEAVLGDVGDLEERQRSGEQARLAPEPVTRKGRLVVGVVRAIRVRAGQASPDDRSRAGDLHHRMIGSLVTTDIRQDRLALFECHRLAFLTGGEPRRETCL